MVWPRFVSLNIYRASIISCEGHEKEWDVGTWKGPLRLGSGGRHLRGTDDTVAQCH
jgi:hypothetical protein